MNIFRRKSMARRASREQLLDLHRRREAMITRDEKAARQRSAMREMPPLEPHALNLLLGDSTATRKSRFQRLVYRLAVQPTEAP